MVPQRSTWAAPLLTSLLWGLLWQVAGCAHRAGYAPPPVDVPKRFSASGTAAPQERWWRAFGDPRLDRLVDQVLGANLDLKAAWERLRQARAVVERESSGLVPDVDAGAGAELRRPSQDTDDTLWLGLSAEYELDLWGRIRSAADAERYRTRATLADYQTARLTLAAEVVRTWYRAVEARGQLKLIERQIEANAKVLQLLEAGFGSGQIRAVDILRQQQTLEATRELRLAAEAELQLLAHQLAVLAGRPPRNGLAPTRDALPGLPPLPAAGLPGELLRRRPDVRRAFHLLQAADREIAAAPGELAGQAQADAAALVLARGVQLLEALEDPLRLLLCGAAARVLDRDLQRPVVGREAHHHAAPGRRQLAGVGQQVAEHPVQLLGVDEGPGQSVRRPQSGGPGER